MTETERYQMATKQVQKLKEFWIHLAAYVVVNAGLVTLNLVIPAWVALRIQSRSSGCDLVPVRLNAAFK